MRDDYLTISSCSSCSVGHASVVIHSSAFRQVEMRFFQNQLAWPKLFPTSPKIHPKHPETKLRDGKPRKSIGNPSSNSLTCKRDLKMKSSSMFGYQAWFQRVHFYIWSKLRDSGSNICHALYQTHTILGYIFKTHCLWILSSGFLFTSLLKITINC